MWVKTDGRESKMVRERERERERERIENRRIDSGTNERRDKENVKTQIASREYREEFEPLYGMLIAYIH